MKMLQQPNTISHCLGLLLGTYYNCIMKKRISSTGGRGDMGGLVLMFFKCRVNSKYNFNASVSFVYIGCCC